MDKEKTQALYLNVYEGIKEDILSGVYKKGKKILSKRALSDRFGVSLITVEHALGILAEEGYIEGRERSGYFVLDGGDGFFIGVNTDKNNTEKNAKSVDGYLDGVLRVSDKEEENVKGEIFPLSVYVKTVRKVLSETPERALKGTSHFGEYRLRKAVSDYLKRSRGMLVAPERIIIGSGSEYFYGIIVRVIGRDKTFAIETPSYKQIENVYASYGVKIEKLRLEKDGINGEDLKRSKAHVLHVSPYRSFPTGISASVGKKREYVLWAKERKGYIIEDDFESEFSLYAKPVDTVFSFDKEGRTIYLNTFSKTISPAVRTGYMILPEPLQKIFDGKLGFYRCSVPTLDQLVIADLIDRGEFERHINKVRRKIKNQEDNS